MKNCSDVFFLTTTHRDILTMMIAKLLIDKLFCNSTHKRIESFFHQPITPLKLDYNFIPGNDG
jgi:hypothetical protein